MIFSVPIEGYAHKESATKNMDITVEKIQIILMSFKELLQRETIYSHPVIELLQELLETTLALPEWDRGGIYFFDPESDELHLGFHLGLPTAYVKRTQHYAADTNLVRHLHNRDPVLMRNHTGELSSRMASRKIALFDALIYSLLHNNQPYAGLLLGNL